MALTAIEVQIAFPASKASPMHRFKNILLCCGSERNETAICRAVELAIENSAKLTLIDVVPHIPKAVGMLTDIAEPQELERLVSKDHRTRLLQVASEYSDTGVAIDVVVGRGKPAVEIVRYVLSNEIDLVIKSAEGESTPGYFFGGVAQSLMRTCPAPVWILKPDVHGPFARILAAVDMDDDDPPHASLNQQILQIATAIATREKAELDVVSVCDLWMESALRRSPVTKKSIGCWKRGPTTSSINWIGCSDVSTSTSSLPTSIYRMEIPPSRFIGWPARSEPI